MFESLTGQKRERGFTQPIMSFALHAGVIALAVGASRERPGTNNETSLPPEVIYIPDRPGPGREVTDRPVSRVPDPVCECEVPFPGPLVVDDFKGGLPKLPGTPFPSLPGIPGRSILDSAQTGVTGVYTEGDLTDSPVLVHLPQPVYPPALKAAGKEGEVQVVYVVDANGDVEPGSITIVSTDHPLMAESVRVSLRAARFRPGMVRGIAVRTLVRQTIRFSLMSL
jgi:TonB family protein